MDLEDLPRLLTIEQAATFLRLTVEQVDQAIADGELAVHRVDRIVFVDTIALLDDLGVKCERHRGKSPREVTT